MDLSSGLYTGKKIMTTPKESNKPSYSSTLRSDMWNSFKIVSIPSYFTNFIWRVMNLYGIAASNEIGTMIWTTAVEIATVIFVACVIIDMSRNYIEAQTRENTVAFKKHLRRTDTNVNVMGDENWYIGSIKLGYKFYFAVVFWTIGYGIFNIFYQNPYNTPDLALRSLGAGIGEFVGLYVSCWSVRTPHKTTLGIAVRGFFEGIVWSLTTDQNWWNTMDGSIGLNGANIIDSLITSVAASSTFTLACLITTTCDYYTQSWFTKTSPNDENELNDSLGSELISDEEEEEDVTYTSSPNKSVHFAADVPAHKADSDMRRMNASVSTQESQTRQ